MIREFFDLYALHRKHNVSVANAKADHYRKFKTRLSALLPDKATEIELLDVGCGKTYPFTYLFGRDGYAVTALDTQYVSAGAGKYIQQARLDGLKVGVKSLVRDILFTGEARRTLREACPDSVSSPRVSFLRASAEEIPLPDNRFDAVFSYCVFEHIPDVDKAARECARVLKPGGVAHITYHLFTSISGSHHNRWFHPDSDPPKDIPPWFHLRDSTAGHLSRLDYGVNRLRLEEYRAVFGEHFDVLEEFSDRVEGEGFLTESIESQLADYTREELVTAFKTVLARKKTAT